MEDGEDTLGGNGIETTYGGVCRYLRKGQLFSACFAGLVVCLPSLMRLKIFPHSEFKLFDENLIESVEIVLLVEVIHYKCC